MLELMTIRERMGRAIGEGIEYYVSAEESVQKGMDVAFLPFTTFEDGVAVPMDEVQMGVLMVEAHGILTAIELEGDGDLTAFTEMGEVFPMTFGADSVEPAPELIEAMNALNNVGEMTGIIQASTGLYIGQLTSLRDEEATQAEIESILEARRWERFQDLLAGWRNTADITMDEEVWDQVSFARLGVEMYQPEEGE
jgi:hypothetical protein